MRRVVLLVLLALAVPIVASADSLDFSNKGGTISATTLTGPLTLGGSALTSYGSIFGANLGSVSFTTAAFATGNFTDGGTLGPGGTFTIMGCGCNGVPSGVIFTTTFTSAQWIASPGTGLHSYRFVGFFPGANGTDGTSQITATLVAGKGFMVAVGSGDTIVTTTVPEPGTLGLLGTGLLAVGGLVRRKLTKG